LAKMREIDPQSEIRLTEALRRLAASSSQGAPPEIGASLLGEFRRHHARRKRIRGTGVLALAAGIVLAAMWLSLSRAGHQSAPGRQAESTSAGLEKQTPAAPPMATPGMRQAARKTSSRPPSARGVRAGNRAFLALPGYDPAVPVDELQVVRVQLPASALWKIGAPVGADAGERRMTADFVMNQDGTPYAVRLVQ
jgi:hypothetical protein